MVSSKAVAFNANYKTAMMIICSNAGCKPAEAGYFFNQKTPGKRDGASTNNEQQTANNRDEE